MTKIMLSKLVMLILATLCMTSIITLIGCPKPNNETIQKPESEIKVGAILGLTGDNASYGLAMQRGYEFALSELESTSAMKGKKVKLMLEDSQFDPAKAVTAYQKLHGAQGVSILAGITGSKNAIPVCEAAKSDDIVIVDPLGSAPMLTKDGGPNYFRIMASDALAGKYNVDWALANGMKRPAIVFMEDDWGSSYCDSLKSYLEQKGIANAPTYGILPGKLEFRTEVEKLKGKAPDAIFLLLYAKEGSSFMQQLRQASVNAKVYGSDNISSSEFVTVGNNVVEGVFVALPAEAHGERYDGFIERYKAKFNEDPDASVIKSYDAMMLLAAAIIEVGSEPSKIREYLSSPAYKYEGISGTIQFDANGDLVSQEYTRMVYRSGKLTPVPSE